MTTAAIRHKLYDYIRVAEDKKVKAIYALLAGEIEEDYDYWNDKNFVAELKKRSADLKNGNTEGVSWEESKATILDSVKRKSK